MAILFSSQCVYIWNLCVEGLLFWDLQTANAMHVGFLNWRMELLMSSACKTVERKCHFRSMISIVLSLI